jgi:hypothetical protein
MELNYFAIIVAALSTFMIGLRGGVGEPQNL